MEDDASKPSDFYTPERAREELVRLGYYGEDGIGLTPGNSHMLDALASIAQGTHGGSLTEVTRAHQAMDSKFAARISAMLDKFPPLAPIKNIPPPEPKKFNLKELIGHDK